MSESNTSEMTIGIDLGDKHSQSCVLDAVGEVVEEARLMTTPAALRQRFASCPPARIAIEASTHSPWVWALLTELGHEVLVANPRKLRMIFTSDSKTDRFDAAQLARVARLDPKLLHPIQHRGPRARADLGLLRSRDMLVRTRAHLVTHVRSSVKAFGARLSGCSTAAFGRRAARQVPRELRQALIPVLRTIEELSKRIARYERRIEMMCREQYPETRVLRQVDGVGPVTSLTYVLKLEDPRRFKSRSVGAWLGLRPKKKQSGSRDPELRISKAGDRELRRLLVQSAQYILGPFGKDSDLRRFGERIALRGGKAAKRRAVVAVARKLSVLLHSLWLTGEVYEPLRNARRERRCPQPA